MDELVGAVKQSGWMIRHDNLGAHMPRNVDLDDLEIEWLCPVHASAAIEAAKRMRREAPTRKEIA